MSLRVKIELILITAISLVVALGYWFQRDVVLPGLIPLEQEQAEAQLMRCFQGLCDQIALINEQCGEWAKHINLQQFVVDEYKGPVEPGQLAPLLVEKHLNLAYALDTDGTVLWGTALDPQTHEPLQIKELSGPMWPAHHPLLGIGEDKFITETFLAQGYPVPATDENESVAGIFLTEQYPALVSSRPVRGDGKEGLIEGRLVVGRFLDKDLLMTIRDQTGIPFYVWALNKPIAQKERRLLHRVLEPFTTYVEEVPNEEQLLVYATYPDVRGRPALLLRRKFPQGVLPKALRAIQWGMLGQLTIGLASLFATILLLRIILMRPLAKLIAHATAIRETQDLSARLRLKHDDEIGVLSGAFDAMVEQIERDRENRVRAEEALRESEERYALAVRGANDGLYDWNLRTNEVYFSPRWKSMLGYAEDEIGNAPDNWFNLIHPEDLDQVKANLETHLKAQSEHFESEHRTRHKDNTYLWMLCRAVAVRDENDGPTRIAGSQTDVTERKRAEEQLAHDAFHDSLTQLPNRALFLDRLEQAIRHAKRYPHYQFAVLFLDLDRFKVVNDSLGHAVGDQLLHAFARTLEACLREDAGVDREADTIARFGSDEFVVLLNDITDISDAIRVADRIKTVLEIPFRIGDHEVFTSASTGIALSATGYEQPGEFLRNADTAMYRAKAKGKARHEVFDIAMHTQAVARLQVETDLRNALERQELVAYYQPIVDLEKGTIHAFEALVRWRHPERGLVSPAEFIPIAEETGLIIPIGHRVLVNACRQVRAWHDQIPTASTVLVSVNLSTKQFQQADLVESVAGVLTETGLEPSFLKLEITESAIMENVEEVNNTLIRLRDMGIMLSLDDFGTGYCSLSYLHRFPMSVLKIDQSFVKDLHLKIENWQIVHTIAILAKNLEMDVIAEGIETKEQLDKLKELHCQYGQGYYFSKPLPPEEATELLTQNASW